jgi:ribosomal protein S7
VEPDQKFQNTHITMLINRMMRGGKKSTAQTNMYRALEIVEQRTKREPMRCWNRPCNAASVEVKPSASAVRRIRFRWKCPTTFPVSGNALDGICTVAVG